VTASAPRGAFRPRAVLGPRAVSRAPATARPRATFPARAVLGAPAALGGRAGRAGRTASAAGLIALGLALAGCGIRTTSVPVDAGPAPSRVSCAQPKAPGGTAADIVQRDVYLVCSMQVAPVERDVRVRVGPGGTAQADRARLVQDLIDQLQISPRAAESAAGFSTAVPGPLAVSPPRSGDGAGTVRLNQPLDELPSFALAQIVCTLTADPAVSPDRFVVLAGPGATDRPRRYTCTPDLRTRPEAADVAGTPVA
jgi:hypothetical protein